MVQPGAKRAGKRPRASNEQSGSAKKARKLNTEITTAHVDESAEDVGVSTHRSPGRKQKAHKLTPESTTPHVDDAPFKNTPATRRAAHHSSLVWQENKIIYAKDMELQIAAEARGVTRKDIPLGIFHSIYLCDFSAEAGPKLAVNSVMGIGEGDWEEGKFLNRLRNVLSRKVRYLECALSILCLVTVQVLRDLELFSSGTKTLSGVDKGKEVPSQPDFVLHVSEESPSWADVDLVFEHTQSSAEVITKKFSQWLRNAWSVFYHQPFRRRLYGVMFLRPCAYICYADHGCAVYSEPLYFVNNSEHTQFLIDFLSGFIANPERRGRDPTVKREENKVYIRHAEKSWLELPKGLLWYRPNLIGRNIRVAWVESQAAEFPERRVVMKSTWEEKLPSGSSPLPEAEVLNILVDAKVRGLPQVYGLDYAIVKDGDLEVETSGFPENCKVALPASTRNSMEKMERNFVSSHTSKYLVPTEGPAAEPFPLELKVRKHIFNEPLEVRRRLTRIIMSYCKPLKEAIRNEGPETLMRIIRDAMIVYYEAYKLPEHGYIHGGKALHDLIC